MVTAYEKAEGVTKVEVDYDKKLAVISYNPAKTSVEKLIAVLKGTKYSAAEKKA